MTLKKANAAFGLLTILFLLVHAGYQMFAFVAFMYNPVVTRVLGWACAGAVMVHAVLGMCIMMFAHDGSALRQYPRQNRRTILQRATAIGILVLLPLHIEAYGILTSGTPGLIAAEIIQLLFFSCVFFHVATSFSNAFVTLGWLEDMDRKKKIDRAVWAICSLSWAAAVIVVGRTYLVLAAMH